MAATLTGNQQGVVCSIQGVSALLHGRSTQPLPAPHPPCCRRSGRWNAVMFWYKLHLFGDVYLSTGPEAVAEGGLRAFDRRLPLASVACWRTAQHALMASPAAQQPCNVHACNCTLAVHGLLPICQTHMTLPPPGGAHPAQQACAACSPRCSTLLGSWRCMRGM